MISAVSSHAQHLYDAARRNAATFDRTTTRGRIVVSGADRASYLQGLLTNDITGLTAGHGCYAAYLTAQGRMIADMHVYELGDVILITTERQAKDVVLARLDQFIFSEDVQLGDVTETFSQLAVVGPNAGSILHGLLNGPDDALASLPEHGNVRAHWRERPVIVTRTSDMGEPGYDVFVDRAELDALRTAVIAAGAADLDEQTADAIRIEGGVPLFHRDMDEETIPLEAGIEPRAINFTKGCYVGQEVIIRVLHRGHGRVARKLVGVTLDGGEPPATGAAIRSGERDIGQVTSGAMSPGLKRAIALGYVQRDFVAPGTRVTIDGRAATVTPLPFVPAQSQ